jgi:hypothetical protein
MKTEVKSLILSSGGLDSVLVSHIVAEYFPKSTVLYFINPFDMCAGGCSSRNHAENAAKKLGLNFRAILMEEDYLRIIANPKHGYGKNANPCIDCRIYMLRRAANMMNSGGYDFIATGEVIGQRPMSQFMRSLKMVEEESGLKRKIIRPLSGMLLPRTELEDKGLIPQEMLFDISGRSRKRQYELARTFKIDVEEHLTPAGGCRLTEREYAKKVFDLLDKAGALKMIDVTLLSYGRHFRINDNAKLVVGRNEQENNSLYELCHGSYIIIRAEDYPGPICVFSGPAKNNALALAASICGRYADCAKNENIRFRIEKPGSGVFFISEATLSPEDSVKYLIC